MQTDSFPNCTLEFFIRLVIFVYPNTGLYCTKNATNVTCEVHLNHHLQDATEIQKMEQIVKCFCFYKLQTYHYTWGNNMTESAIIFRVVNLPGNKGSGKYWEIPGNTGKYREIGNQWAHNCGWQILWPVLRTKANYSEVTVE